MKPEQIYHKDINVTEPPLVAEFFYGSECLGVSQSKRFDVPRRKMDVSSPFSHAVGKETSTGFAD
jgi:hypothetical protein